MGNLRTQYGTWTPTITGQTTAGTTTYGTVSGSYVIIGRMVYAIATMPITAATGTGRVLVGGLPFTIENATERTVGICVINSAVWSWQAGITKISLLGRANETNCDLVGSGSSKAMVFQQMQNTSATFYFSICYQTRQ